MKNLYFIFLLFVSVNLSAQTKGITYQAIIYNPSGESIPGVNNATAPMANKSVCLQFSIVDASSQVEYQELISTTTDEYGMVNLVIGNGVQSSGYASSFSTIAWSVDQKSLKVALDIAGQCSDFVDISNQKFESVPYAFSANTADNISGILPIENGGTNAASVLGAKTNLGLENVDNTSDLNKPISTATQAALDLKEDQVNKSTATTLGTSDVLYPTQNAVKTYVDAGTNNINTAIANEAAIRAAADNVLTTNLATEVTNRINGDNTLTTNLATEVTNRINGDNTLTTNLATEVLNRTNADVVLTNNLATEVTNRTNADLLKEDLANKSTATTLGTSDILYPTQNAVKTYVDVTSTSNTTAINNEAAIRAAADVVLTNNLAIEVTNRTNADLLKENLANKSTATTLGTSNDLYPSQNAVKTYVDANAAANAAAVSNEAAIRAAADLVLTNNLATEVTDRTNADLLKENLSNKSTSVNLGLSDVEYPSQKAVKTYVDAASNSTNNALNNEAIIRAAADNNLTINLAAEVSSRTIGDNNLNAAVLTEVTTRENADLLKENLANKSTSTTLGTSNVLYPSQNAVKTYVDASALTINSTISNEASIRAAADLQLNTNLTSEINDREDADLLKENLSNKSNNLLLDGTSTVKYPTVKTVKDYVDSNATMLSTDLTNESLARAAGDNTLTTNLVSEANNRINADLQKENLSNKSTATSLGTSDVLYPTQNAVKSYVDATVTVGNAGINNEAAIRAAADAVLTSNLATEITNRSNADLAKENLSNKSTATTLGTSNVLYPTQNAVKTYVDAQVAMANIADADATTKGKLQLAGDLAGTAAAPTVPALALKAPIASPTFTGTPAAPTAAAGTNTTQVATTEFVTGAIATATIPDATTTAKGKIQLAGDLAGTAAAPTVPGLALKAPIASPTFTGTVTSPIYASTPQALTDGTTISWNPTNGLNASVTLGGNRTLSFASLPAVGSYGTLIVTQDGTGNRTITLPSTSNKVLGSASTTTIALSTAPNAKDILNFYYDGTNCYWNIGQGYGTAAAAVVTNLSTGIAGTLPVANGGSGTTTLTGIVKGNGTSAMTAAVAGTDYVIPSGSITGNAGNVTGTVAIANGGTGQTTVDGVKGILGLNTNKVAIGASSGTTNQGTGAVGIGNGTGQTNQGSQSVAIGYVAGNSNQGANSVAIGSNAAQSGQGTQSVAIGIAANSSANNSTALGGYASAGHTNATALGFQAVTTANNTIQLGADGVSVAGSTAITNVKTSGTLTAGTVTYPNTHGSSGQVLSTTGSGTLTWVAPSASSLSGTVAVANGGTGATTATGALTNLGAAPIASPTFTGTPAAPTAAAGTNTTQVATTEFVTGAIATATIPDATTTAKGKIQLAGDLSGTAALPVVAANAITTSKILDANVTDAKIATVSGSKVTGNITGSAANVTGTVAVANGGTGAITAAGALTNLGAAPIASPTFTGTVTSPIYASTPQALTDGTTISWNPTNGLNASVTLGGNRTLSFASLPAVGSYGTLIVTQDATGNRTITLPSTSNKVLGSASTTTIALSTAPNAKDILNFYYDGTNCYWNIGQGYGTAATAASTNLTSSVSGTLPIANGGTGATTKTSAFDALSPMTTSGDIIYGGLNGTGTRLSMGSNGSILTMENNLPTWNTSIKATAGSSYNAPVGFSFIGGDWARNTGMFSDNPDAGGSATLKFRIATSNSTANSYLEINPSKVSVLPTTASTSKTTGALTVAGGLGVDGNIYTNNLNASGTLTAGTVTYPNTHNSTAGQVLTTNASGFASWTTPSGSAHYIGESYGGGIVFYTWDNGAHGLIGADTELKNGQAMTWGGGSNSYVGTTSFSGVLGGKLNTQRILNVIPVPTYGNGDPQTGQRAAAFYAATYLNSPVVVNGVTTTPQFSDWYLPNAYELTLFATQSALFPNCNFATHDHWTSSERSDYAGLAYALGANSNTYIYQTSKSSTIYVVAIRSF